VAVVNVGTPDTEPTLRKALAIGLTEAIINAQQPMVLCCRSNCESYKIGSYDLIIAEKNHWIIMVPGAFWVIGVYNFVNSCTEHN
jgi:electron transfer flavoprotein beta subunit